MRWLLAGPLAGLGAAAGVIAALPDTHHRGWWITACGVGSGLAALIALLPSRKSATRDLAPTGISAKTLNVNRSGVVIGQQHAAQGGIVVGQQHQSGLNATLQTSREMHIGNLTITQNSPPSLPLRQRRTWTIPPPVPSFIGRQSELGLLRQQLTANKSAVLVPTTALHGPGGIGKTQLALAYASLWRAEYELGWWIPAETTLSMLAAFAELATALGLPQGLSPELLVHRVHEELSDRIGWLLIFDNAPDHVFLSNFLPRMGDGHVLITSRSLAWRGVANPIQIDVMSPDEAMAFLESRTGESDQEAAGALAEALGFLPLALEQAAEYANSFLSYHPHPVARYAEMFQKRREDLLARGRPLAYEGTVDATLSLSVERIADSNIGAIRLLEICALVAPEEIPLAAFLDLPALLPPPLDGGAHDPLVLEEAMGAILRMGVLSPDVNGTMSIHRLMQTVILARQSEEARNERLRQAVALVNALMPSETWEPERWPRCMELLPHAETVVEHYGTAPIPDADLGSLLTKAGSLIWARGLGIDRAAAMHRMALAIYRQLHHGDHTDVACGLYDLAADLRELGDIRQAQRLHIEALEMRQRLYPGDHPEVARSLNALAIDMSVLDENEAARDLHEKALEMRQRLYSGDHPDLATSLNDLAIDLRELGKARAAKLLDRRALAMRQRLYGPADHPEIAISLYNLSNDTRPWNAFHAVKLARAALKMFQRLYQGDHLNIAKALSNLGICYEDVLLFWKAHKLHEQALAMDFRLFEGDHLEIASALKTLAENYRVTLRPRRARDLDLQAFSMFQALYQEAHPNIIRCLVALAIDNLMVGRLRQSVTLFRQASRMRRRLRQVTRQLARNG